MQQVKPKRGRPQLTHCGNGHELSGDNLRQHRRADGTIGRACKICRQAIERRSKNKSRMPEISVRVTFELLGLEDACEEIPKAEAVFDGKPSGADLRFVFDKLIAAIREKLEEAAS